jgi:hypothetical protein
MNMISTGAFLTEMDASQKQNGLVEKLVAAWEKKNAKLARAGGVSLMALSLAACGSDDATTTTATSDTTTTTTTVAPVVTGGTFDLTPLTDVASGTTAVNGSISSTFRFTSADDTINGIGASIQAADTLLDASTTDTDVLNITSTAAMNAMTSVNIETANVTMASGTPTAVFTNFTGLTTVNVTGTVAGTVTDAGTAAVNLDGYTRIATINDSTGLGGTAAAGTAETMNVTVSGTSYGSTAATQSGVTLTAINTGANETLETLNITSGGTAANDFALDVADVDVVLDTTNLLGANDLTVRVTHAGVTGTTVVGSANTANTTVMIDRTGATTTDTNVHNFSGIDNITVKDSAAPAVGGDGGDMIGLKSGQTVTLADDFNTTVLTVTPATYTSMADSLTVALDNETAATNTDVASLNVQNTKTLNIISDGHGASVSTNAATVNLLDALVGDATTVTVTGDTALNLDANIDAVQTATTATTARAVTVDASGMTGTAFLDFAADANAKVSYNVTGSANADTIVMNASGGIANGGAGADVITTGAGAETVDGGAGKDHIDTSYGADSITGGSDADTYDVDAVAAAAVQEVNTIVLTAVGSAADDFTVTIDGVVYAEVATGTIDTDGAKFVTDNAAEIQVAHDVAVTYTAASDTLTLTGKADGTNFTATSQHNNGGTYAALTVGDTTVASLALDMDTTITDFAAGDVIDVDGFTTSATTVYHEGTAANVATTDTAIVLTGASYANVAAAEDAYNAAGGNIDGVVAFFNNTTGTAQMFRDNDLDTDGNLADTSVFLTFSNITSLSTLASAFSSDSVIM